MNLSCPSCGTESTMKLSLMISRGATATEGFAKFGGGYIANVMVPLAGTGLSLLAAMLFGLMNTLLGFLVFIGGIYATIQIRRKVKSTLQPVTQQKLSKLDNDTKQRGYQCQRCEHIFVPAA